ncbi:MAG TPA: hypothetical protein VL475_09555 [Planctomycetaceae bacterium]|nr:hypothetical protein [Planctomycetaceae bacterium]
MSDTFHQLLKRLMAAVDPIDPQRDAESLLPLPASSDSNPVTEPAIPGSTEFIDLVDRHPAAFGELQPPAIRKIHEPAQQDNRSAPVDPHEPFRDLPIVPGAAHFAPPETIANVEPALMIDPFVSRLFAPPLEQRAESPTIDATLRETDSTADSFGWPLSFPSFPAQAKETVPLTIDGEPASDTSQQFLPTAADVPSEAPERGPTDPPQLENLLDSLDRQLQSAESGQSQALDRLNELLERTRAAQSDQFRLAERIDQLEAAQLLRGRL